MKSAKLIIKYIYWSKKYLQLCKNILLNMIYIVTQVHLAAYFNNYFINCLNSLFYFIYARWVRWGVFPLMGPYTCGRQAIDKFGIYAIKDTTFIVALYWTTRMKYFTLEYVPSQVAGPHSLHSHIRHTFAVACHKLYLLDLHTRYELRHVFKV